MGAMAPPGREKFLEEKMRKLINTFIGGDRFVKKIWSFLYTVMSYFHIRLFEDYLDYFI